ncbi:hypothetical protein JKF63_07208 [Porcisia hertigi]|uniref:Uncharacterized protein n=1 Tax=Porcisia hertigi TaxID=2761500 RepID=A0A836LL73_9TRYP|nr:hypothetical protein JKF63_07208 [Porcisia hertigi]
MWRCLAPIGAWVASRARATTVSSAVGRGISHLPVLTGANENKSASGTSATASAAPTSEDYRALLLDLLLYRRETLAPVVEALSREREEVEQKMQQLDTHVRELSSIRDELRKLSEAMLEAEQRRLHDIVMDHGNSSVLESTRGGTQARGNIEEVEEIVL